MIRGTQEEERTLERTVGCFRDWVCTERGGYALNAREKKVGASEKMKGKKENVADDL